MAQTIVKYVEPKAQDIWAVLERESQKRFGISARELHRQYHAKELVDPSEASDLLILFDLLPASDFEPAA